MEHANGTVAFFQAMAPALANVLTSPSSTASQRFTQKELKGEEEGRLTYLWLIVIVILFMLYGLYTWGVYPFKK